jgi:ribosome biogenesis protein BMS1
MIVDRHEDITHPNKIAEEPSCERSITFYGYIRGTHLKPETKMHLIGVGDYPISELSAMADPCPLPDQDKKSQVRKLLYYITLLLYDQSNPYIFCQI